ncbi:MAG: zinc ABC transporter substrate-binding protein [Amylibacter sp.]|nr:zinc ABC transporter substrate-binding protein [Amylibacter sp.]
MLYYHTSPPRRFAAAFAIWCTSISACVADVPSVVTDIPPIHSLVAQVMQGLGTPSVLISGNTSPHGYSMRPSQAASLASADLVFLVGPELTPWLETSLGTLANDATVTALLHTKGTNTLEFRVPDEFTEDAETTEHQDHHDDHDHGHEGLDPHAWLNPDNANLWLQVIADQLSQHDVENANIYQGNAQAAKNRIANLVPRLKAQLEIAGKENIIVYHDAFQYFEKFFDLKTVGTIVLNDASQPSPARLSEVKAKLHDEKVACVFTEAQFNSGLVDVVIEGTTVKTASLDPLGGALELGPELFGEILSDLADEISSCVAP